MSDDPRQQAREDEDFAARDYHWLHGQPPWISFEEWLEKHATPEERETVKRVFPTLAKKYGWTQEDL